MISESEDLLYHAHRTCLLQVNCLVKDRMGKKEIAFSHRVLPHAMLVSLADFSLTVDL